MTRLHILKFLERGKVKVRLFAREIKIAFSFAAIVFQMFMTGCTPQAEPVVCIEYYAMGSSERLKRYSNYPVEAQLAIHRCGLLKRPPDILTYKIADKGADLIPFLSGELERLKDDRSYEATTMKYGIVLIFGELKRRGEMPQSPKLSRLISDAIDSIYISYMRDEARNAMEQETKPVTDFSH